MRPSCRGIRNLIIALGLAGGCAGDLSAELNKPDSAADPGAPTVPGQSGRVTSTLAADGVVASQICSSSTVPNLRAHVRLDSCRPDMCARAGGSRALTRSMS